MFFLATKGNQRLMAADVTYAVEYIRLNSILQAKSIKFGNLVASIVVQDYQSILLNCIYLCIFIKYSLEPKMVFGLFVTFLLLLRCL